MYYNIYMVNITRDADKEVWTMAQQADEDLFDQLNDFLLNYDTSKLINDQENFVLWMDLTQRLSWDIPSALPFDIPGDKEAPMHRDTKDYFDNDLIAEWEAIDRHYKENYGLDLTDHRINWSFDT
jgi:hypothetical protein